MSAIKEIKKNGEIELNWITKDKQITDCLAKKGLTCTNIMYHAGPLKWQVVPLKHALCTHFLCGQKPSNLKYSVKKQYHFAAYIDNISYNVVKICFGELCDPLSHIFNLWCSSGTFPDSLKIGKVTPIYQAGDSTDLGNYGTISVLPCFSKVLEHIIYNRLYTVLWENKIVYYKHFGFQAGHSTDHAILQLLNQIYENSEENKYILGVFIDLSEAIDTVDHKIVLGKLEIFDIKGKWLQSYLTNRKQYIQIDKKTKTAL